MFFIIISKGLVSLCATLMVTFMALAQNASAALIANFELII